MFKFPFNFDLISFWIGFVIAILLWWLSGKVKLWIVKLNKYNQDQQAKTKKKNVTATESVYRQQILAKAQSNHIARSLFTLDEILVEPKLIAPPLYIVNPQNFHEPSTIVDQTIPYTPAWPELSAYYPVSRLTLPQACYHNANIAVMGQPGSGKTIMLADFVSLIARKSRRAGKFAEYLPIFLHALDVLEILEKNDQPDECIIDLALNDFSASQQKKLLPVILSALKENRAVFILDGVDELIPSQVDSITEFLRSLLKKYPRLITICATSPDYLDGLLKLGFFPLVVAAWNNQDRQELIMKWSKAWNRHIMPELVNKAPSSEINEGLVNAWLVGLHPFFNPLELTLALWGTYSADVTGLEIIDLIEAYLRRCAPGIPHFLLEVLASTLVTHDKPSLPQSNMESILNKQLPPKRSEISDRPNDSSIPVGSPGRDQAVSSGSRIIAILLENNVLQLTQNGNIRFANPYIAGYLASFQMADISEAIVSLPKWTIQTCALNFVSAQGKANQLMKSILSLVDPTLFREIGLVSRWLRDMPRNSEDRKNIVLLLAGLIIKDNIPVEIRAGFVIALIRSADNLVLQVLNTLIKHASPTIRFLGAIGLGALRNSKAIQDLVGLYSDPQQEVRNAACLAISAVNSPECVEILAETLLHGDEFLRQAAAESFAKMANEGYEILKDAVTIDDLLTRRAAVQGLVLIREDWVKTMLEEMSVKDGQWIVRNAAAQALDVIQKPFAYIPRRLTRPAETSWIIDYAAQLKMGVPADELAVEILVHALQNGSSEQKICSLQYLIRNPDEGIIRLIFDALYRHETTLSGAAYHALWLIGLEGVSIPAPQKFGYL